MKGADHVQSARTEPLEFHHGGAQEPRGRVGDGPGPCVRTDGSGPGRNNRWGFHRRGFLDQRRTALVIASGPSAAGSLAACPSDWAAWPAITVNSSWRLHPGADALYAADGAFWRVLDPASHQRYVEIIRSGCSSTCFTCDERAASEFGLYFIRAERKTGLSTEENTVRIGGQIGNSGAQAINLAYLFGARRILLVGFDMHRAAGEHWHGAHPKGLRNESDYSSFIAGMGAMAVDLHKLGIEVLNCSAGSKLPYWKKKPLAEALQSS